METNEYIKRASLPEKKERGFFLDDDFNAGWNACLNNIEAIPAATVAACGAGKWEQDCDYHYRCSVCGDRWTVSNGNPLDISNGWNYCPNCGADMRGE